MNDFLGQQERCQLQSKPFLYTRVSLSVIMASTDHLRVEGGKFLAHLKPEQKLSNPQIELKSAKMPKKERLDTGYKPKRP